MNTSAEKLARPRCAALLLAVVLITTLPLSAEPTETSVPVWYQNRTLAYPERDFISATGTGISEQAARDDALSALSLYFDAHITAERTTALSGSESTFGIEKRRSASAETQVGSNAQLAAVAFSDSFYNAVRHEYAVCAYINRAAAISEYSARLAHGVADANALVTQAESAEASGTDAYGAFTCARNAQKALSSLAVTAQQLSVLDSARGLDTMRSIGVLSSRCRAIASRIKPLLTFSVQLQNDDDGSIALTVQSLLESRGFSCDSAQPRYRITGAVRMTESQNAVGVFVRPALTLSVTAPDGSVVGSYSRQYPKYGHNNLDGARAKARVEIEKDVKSQLLDALF